MERMDEVQGEALPKMCTIKKGGLIPCWGIFRQAEASTNFGLHFHELTNMKDGTTRIAAVYVGKFNSRKKGDKMAFNYCPFCGANLHTENGGYVPGTEPPEITAKREAYDPQPRELPRRCYVDRYTPAETAIREAMRYVEDAGCHQLLTEAVVLLGQAKDKVADFVDDPAQ